MKLRASAYLHRYGLAAAGAAARSFVGQLPSKRSEIGPVVGVSFVTASRIANALRAGTPERDGTGFNQCRVVLLHSPADHLPALLDVLEAQEIDWTCKPLVICDCDLDVGALDSLAARGALVASVRRFGIKGLLAVRGEAPAAVVAAQRIARDLDVKPVVIPAGAEDAFEAALTLANGALTPLLDSVATLLREAGVREGDAARLAATFFQKTAAEYGHSGRQSWSWYAHGPIAAEMERQIYAAGPQVGSILRALTLLGFDIFGKHADVAAELSNAEPEPDGSPRFRAAGA